MTAKTTTEYTCQMCGFTETKVTDRDESSTPVYDRTLAAPWGYLEWSEEVAGEKGTKWMDLDLCPGCLARVLSFISSV